jgi:uncharacterized Tic20 family protein
MNRPKSEERFLAILAHLSAVAFGMGMVLPAALWSEGGRKSKYVAFQTLQAYGYQSLGYTVWFLLYFLVFLLFYGGMTFVITKDGNAYAGDRIPAAFTMLFLGVTLILLGIYFLFPLIAAVACGLGLDFRYPILGTRLAKYLGYAAEKADTAMDEVNVERWVAAMGHFSVVVMLWGLLAPLVVWLTHRKTSVYLERQSAQTFIYQLLGTIFYVGMACLAMAAFVPMIFLSFSGNFRPEPWMLGVVMGGLCVFSIIALVIPLYHILGQWAGLQVLRGRDYRYPLIGRLSERWLLEASQKERANENSDRI